MSASGENFDLHCHSSASDGVLTPAELVRRAADRGVPMLALTDHDELGALAEARGRAAALGVRLVDGVEISVTWRTTTVHVVGLGIDPANGTLRRGLEKVRGSRAARAARIAEGLAAAGIPDSLAGAYAQARNPRLIGRTHFARFLVERGHARDVKSVFDRYLVAGRPGHVPHRWAELADAVGWIRAAGGRAVVAHPGRYKIHRGAMRELLAEFRAAGGEGIEVVTGSHRRDQYGEFAALARELDLLASRGSDFHAPGEGADLGALPPLPGGLRPVWHDW
ncbi:MAG: PHP domain-containing protein [Burkholderiales bacterium]|nr:PHP domain-containing protein [Burkholderiales bacterium]